MMQRAPWDSPEVLHLRKVMPEILGQAGGSYTLHLHPWCVYAYVLEAPQSCWGSVYVPFPLPPCRKLPPLGLGGPAASIGHVKNCNRGKKQLQLPQSWAEHFTAKDVRRFIQKAFASPYHCPSTSPFRPAPTARVRCGCATMGQMQPTATGHWHLPFWSC